MRLPRWLRPVPDIPTRQEITDHREVVRNITARGDREAATARTLRSQNELGALVERALGLRNAEGHL